MSLGSALRQDSANVRSRTSARAATDLAGANQASLLVEHGAAAPVAGIADSRRNAVEQFEKHSGHHCPSSTTWIVLLRQYHASGVNPDAKQLTNRSQ